MKAKDLRTQSDKELYEDLLKLRKEALKLRFQKVSGQLESTAKIRGVKRAIARIKTVLGERSQTRKGA